MKNKNFTIKIGGFAYMFNMHFDIENYELSDVIFINRNDVDEAEKLREYLISNGWIENKGSDKIVKEIDTKYDEFIKELIEELEKIKIERVGKPNQKIIELYSKLKPKGGNDD